MLKIILEIEVEAAVRHTHTTRSLLGSDTDMVFCYEIAQRVSGECEIVGRTLSLSVQGC